jgi:hypothetical protein
MGILGGKTDAAPTTTRLTANGNAQQNGDQNLDHRSQSDDDVGRTDGLGIPI